MLIHAQILLLKFVVFAAVLYIIFMMAGFGDISIEQYEKNIETYFAVTTKN